MPTNRSRFFSVIVVATDAIAITVSFMATYLFRFHTGVIPLHGLPNPEDYSQALLVVVPIYLLFFRAYGLYSSRKRQRRIEEIFQTLKASTMSVIILMSLTFFYRGFSFSRVYLILLWIFSMLFVSLGRYLLISYEYRRRIHQKDIDRVLLVGANRNTRQIIEWAKTNIHYGKQIIGILSQDPASIGKHFEDIPVIGSITQSESFILESRPDEVILLETSLDRQKISDLVAICEDQFVDFKMAADLYGIMSQHVDVEYLSTVPLLGFRNLPLDDLWNRVLKRTFDIVISFLMIFFTFPIWITAMVLIKLQDRGPIFYKQDRMGRDQKIFKVYKFRTMRVDAEKETGPVWAQANDQRRTGLGGFLRRWNIDELPQLWNVLAGDMSLVGPRPERPHFIERFRDDLPRYMSRHKVKSGLTGWAAVHGYRGNTSIEERLKYDLYYMENWSLLLDLEILFMTLFAFKNAY